jgi:lipoate-protein ligase A
LLLTERPPRPRTVTWRLVVDPHGRRGAEHMAIDAALLERADATDDAFLRLYRFDPPCLSLGRHEATGSYDRAAIARLGVDVVRRPTGGGAVWHEHEVTYAIAAPIAAFGGLRDAYHAIHARLAAALRTLGVDAALASDRQTAHPPDRPGPCFAHPAGGEVLIGGRKVVGSAQVRRGAALLQHGSILLDGSQQLAADVSRTAHAASGATTLAEALGRPVTWQEVVAAVAQAWGDECTPTALSRPLPPSTARFLDPAWTWRR